MRKFPRHDIREDLELSMTVRAEPVLGSDPIFIDDPKASKLVMSVIVIRGEREGVKGLEPTVVSVPSLLVRTSNEGQKRHLVSSSGCFVSWYCSGERPSPGVSR